MKLFLLFSIIISTHLLADLPEIAPNRMITDYQGVSYFDNKILCYGDYGIITYSEDLGKTWKQISIGDEFNLKKMTNNDIKIFGITDNELLVSDNGLVWEQINLTEQFNFTSVCADDEEIYFIANKNIYLLDENSNITMLQKLEFDHTYQNLSVYNKNLFFIQDSLEVKKFDINNNLMTTVFDKNHKYNDFDKISDLKIINDKIYFSFLQLGEFNYQLNNCIYCNANDMNWQKVQNSGTSYDSFFIKNNEFFWIRAQYFYNIFHESNRAYLKYCTYKVDDTKKNILYSDSTYIKNSDFYNISMFNITQTINIKEDIIVSVGNGKSIIISYDGGKSFEIISQVSLSLNINRHYFGSYECGFLINQNKIISNNLSLSTDGGITWKPQKINKNNCLIFNDINFQRIFTKNIINGKDIFIYDNYLYDITNDIFKIINENYSNKSDINNLQGLFYENQIINSYTDSFQKNLYTEFNIIDTNYNFIETIRIDSTYFKNIFITNDNELLALAYISKDYEPGSNWKTRKYVLLKSKNIKDWKEVEIDLPMADSSDRYRVQYMYKNKLLMINNSYNDQSDIIYYFDIDEITIDSIRTPFIMNNIGFYEQVFEHKENIYFVSNDSKLFYTSNLFAEEIDWNTIDIKQYFPDWDQFDPLNQMMEKDVLYAGISEGEQIYLIAGKSYKTSGNIGPSTNRLKFNLIPLFDVEIQDTTSVEDTEIRNYLYSYPPYPIPAKTQVNTIIYWDKNISMDKESIKIYDINGMEVSRQEDITLEQETAYKGRLTWNCSSVPDGVYLIHIKHGNNAQTIKVIVNK